MSEIRQTCVSPSGFVMRKRLLMACLGAAGLEAVAFWALIGLGGVGGIGLAIVLHCMHAGVPFLAAPRRTEKGRALYYLASCLFLFLPGVGVAGVLAAFGGQAVMRPKGLARDFEKRKLLVEDGLLADDQRSIEQFLQEELSTEPVADLLRSEDQQLKCGVVKLLRDTGGRKAVMMLKCFLHDEDSEVRLFAHTALIRMQEHMARRLETAEQAAMTCCAEDSMALARLYREYAESGLIEDALSGYYLQQACKALNRALEITPDDMRLLEQLGEMLLCAGRHAEAQKCLERASRDPECALDGHLALCRLHYERRDLPSLRQQTLAMREMEVPACDDSDKTELFLFWSSPQPSACFSGRVEDTPGGVNAQ